MMISEDENTVTLEDGTVLVAAEQSNFNCEECFLNNISCDSVKCLKEERNDGRDVIFVKKEKTDE